MMPWKTHFAGVATGLTLGRPFLRHALIETTAALVWICLALPAAALTPPSEHALALVEGMGADRLGVDSAGYLWAWKQGKKRVRVVSPEGRFVAEARVGGEVDDLDVHRDWGVAVVDGDGRRLRVLGFQDQEPLSIDLEDRAGSVAWIDSATVAVAARTAGYRVELWNVSKGIPIQRFGEEADLEIKTGAVFDRAIKLSYDAGRQRLFTLESRTGDLQVFSLAGIRVARAVIDNPEKESLDRWLAGIDEQVRREGGIQHTVLWWFRLALDPRGGRLAIAVPLFAEWIADHVA